MGEINSHEMEDWILHRALISTTRAWTDHRRIKCTECAVDWAFGFVEKIESHEKCCIRRRILESREKT